MSRTVELVRLSNSPLLIEQLLTGARDGDPEALGHLLELHQERLRRVVEFRIDSRIRGRFDATDVVQEAFVEATLRFPEYLENSEMPFFLWLRFITVQKLMQLHRSHLGVKARDAAREVSLRSGGTSQATTAVLTAQLFGDQTSPSGVVVREEMKSHVEEALNGMDEIDREVLALRHFEQLSNSEVARVLDLSETAANNRYVRALKRLSKAMREMRAVGQTTEVFMTP